MVVLHGSRPGIVSRYGSPELVPPMGMGIPSQKPAQVVYSSVNVLFRYRWVHSELPRCFGH
jgi:hypothetical protein